MDYMQFASIVENGYFSIVKGEDVNDVWDKVWDKTSLPKIESYNAIYEDVDFEMFSLVNKYCNDFGLLPVISKDEWENNTTKEQTTSLLLLRMAIKVLLLGSVKFGGICNFLEEYRKGTSYKRY